MVFFTVPVINAQFVFGTPFWPFICPLISCHNFDRWLNPIFFRMKLMPEICIGINRFWMLVVYLMVTKIRALDEVLINIKRRKKRYWFICSRTFLLLIECTWKSPFRIYRLIQITLGTEWMPNIMHPISIINLFDKQLICLCRRCAWTTRGRKKNRQFNTALTAVQCWLFVDLPHKIEIKHSCPSVVLICIKPIQGNNNKKKQSDHKRNIITFK